MKLGFKYTLTNDCLYIKKENRIITLIILVYVNNIVIVSPQSLEIIFFKNALNKDFKITDLGEIKYILGIIVIWDCINDLFISTS